MDVMTRFQLVTGLAFISLLLLFTGCSNKIVPVISADKIEIPQRYKFMEVASCNIPNTYYKFSEHYPDGWPVNLSLPPDAFVANPDGSITTTTYENRIEMHVKVLAKMDIVKSEQYCHQWFDALDASATFGHVSNHAWKGAASLQKRPSKDSLPWLSVILHSDNRLPEYTVISVTYRKAIDANQ
jgi:hypothetical protein